MFILSKIHELLFYRSKFNRSTYFKQDSNVPGRNMLHTLDLICRIC